MIHKSDTSVTTIVSGAHAMKQWFTTFNWET